MASLLPGEALADLKLPGDRNRLLAELGRRGSRGGVIPLHRAMTSGRLTPSVVVSAVIVPMLIATFVLLALRPLGDVWLQALRLLQGALGLPGGVAAHELPLGRVFSYTVPYLTTTARLPATRDHLIVGAACAVFLMVARALPARFTPLSYYLRFGTLVQLTAFLYFAIEPDTFPYALPPYLQSLFEMGSAALVLIPIVFGLTLFPFDIALWRKIVLTLATVGHLAVLIPLQAAIHAYAIYHLSVLVMPAMFFLWGVLVHVFVFVAMYGWGMSWPERDAQPRASRKERTS